TDCTPNGAAEVTDIFVDGLPIGGVAGYDFNWQDDNGITLDGPNATSIIAVPLAEGSYRVRARNTTSNCFSSITTFTVDDLSTPPVITLNTIANNTHCTTPNGEIVIDVDGGVPAVTDYTVAWFM